MAVLQPPRRRWRCAGPAETRPQPRRPPRPRYAGRRYHGGAVVVGGDDGLVDGRDEAVAGARAAHSLPPRPTGPCRRLAPPSGCPETPGPAPWTPPTFRPFPLQSSLPAGLPEPSPRNFLHLGSIFLPESLYLGPTTPPGRPLPPDVPSIPLLPLFTP